MNSLKSFILDIVKLRPKRPCCVVGENASLTAEARITNYSRDPSSIIIGPNALICGYIETFTSQAKIVIGANSFISQNARIWAHDSVIVGSRVLIAHGVTILDSNSHSTSAMLRAEEFAAVRSGKARPIIDITAKPTLIENDAWIGFNSAIMKGVTIGQGAIVGANSTILKDVPPYSIVAGNPAKIIGTSKI